jgi:hypothetical protein
MVFFMKISSRQTVNGEKFAKQLQSGIYHKFRGGGRKNTSKQKNILKKKQGKNITVFSLDCYICRPLFPSAP